MSGFLDLIWKTSKFSVHHDDDFFDRLSHRYTLSVLVLCTFILGTKQYVGEPIHCWTPSHFSAQHVRFTDSICWISNTYYVAGQGGEDRENIPMTISGRGDRELTYYQWFPFILMSMAFLFYLPHIIWRLLNKRSLIDVSSVIDVAVSSNTLNVDLREKTVKYLMRHLDSLFSSDAEHRHGVRLVISFLVVKILYIANSLAQLFLLNAFLRQNFTFYGVEVLSKILNGTEWKEPKRFPRTTFCDFEIRRLGGIVNIHRYTIQCILPINLFSEKIFLFLWFWLVFVAILSCWGMIPWIVSFCYKARRKYVMNYLKTIKTDKALKRTFIDNYVQQDGTFILRLLSKNSNDLLTTDVVLALWENFKKHHSSRFRPEPV